MQKTFLEKGKSILREAVHWHKKNVNEREVRKYRLNKILQKLVLPELEEFQE